MTICPTTTGSASSAPTGSDAPRRRALATTFRALLGLSTALTPIAALGQDLPTGGVVASGEVSIAAPTGGRMTITQGSPSAVVDWQGFGIGAANSVTINQPSSGSAILNRVTGTARSDIHGSLAANGQVYLVNPNGIFIGPTGTVNAGSFTASALGIGTEDFMAGKRRFEGSGASAAVTNAGRIEILPGGYAALLGGRVSNSGVIRAPMGRVGLGAGERATLDLSGDGFLQVAIPSDSGEGDLDALIEQSGTIEANGGQVHIQAATARRAAREAINLSGIVEARTVSGRNGAISLGGGAGGTVRVSGRVRATAPAAVVAQSPRPAPRPETGGDITITGADIVLSGAALDASGPAGGGAIRVGGNLRGAPGLDTARTARVDAATTLRADASEAGDGGMIVVWSDDFTTLDGRISARGGPAGGDGGFAEVSGKRRLAFSGDADLRAPAGARGTLLLDPENIDILDVIETETDNSQIETALLESQLLGADVVIDTGLNEGEQAGNIRVLDDLDWETNSTLSLIADNTIQITGDITAPAGELSLNGFGDGTTPFTATGAIDVGSFELVDAEWEQIAADLPGFAAADFSFDGSASFLRAVGGDGSLDAPYQIVDVYGLQGIATGFFGGANFALADNIDASATLTWAPFPGAEDPLAAGQGFEPIGVLSGDLDGNGFEIVGLYIDRISEHGGLIDTIADLVEGGAGSVTDLRFRDFDVSGQTGGLVARVNQGLISGVVADDPESSVTTLIFGGGGLVAQNQGQIADSLFNAQVIGDVIEFDEVGGSYALGGLVGVNADGASIARSRARGDVLAQEGVTLEIGGLVGTNVGSIEDSVVLEPNVSVETAGNVNAGGVVGRNLGGATIERTHTKAGSVEGFVEDVGQRESLLVGGFAGTNLGSITDSYSLANVTGRNVLIQEIGGLVAVNAGAIENSYSTGAVVSDGGGAEVLNVGGLVGRVVGDSDSTIDASYWDVQTSGQTASDGGTGLTTDEFLDTAGFLAIAGPDGWNFEEIWAPSDAANYPANYSTSPVIFAVANPATAVYTGDVTGFEVSGDFFGGIEAYVFAGPSEFLNPEVLNATVVAESPNVGVQSYTYPAESLPASGGTLVRIVDLPGTITITPAALSVIADDQTKTYGTAFAFDGTEFTTEGLLNGDTVTAASLSSVATAATTGISVEGEYGIDISDAVGTGLGNYDITYVPGIFTVTQAALSVIADDQTKTYGTAFAFDGTEFTTEGLLNGDTVTAASLSSVATAATTGISVEGEYGIDISDAVGTGLGNYDITYVPGIFTVTQAALSVIADDQTKTYGTAFAFDGTEFTTEGLLNGDTVTAASLSSVATAATTGISVEGEYGIDISDAVGTGLGNYDITYVPGIFTVTQAALSVIADDQTKTYGTAFAFDGTEFTTEGLLNGDTVTAASLSSVATAATTGISVEGEYGIDISDAVGTGLGNYDITYVPGIFTVTQAALSVIADDQTKTYGTAFAFDGTEFTTEGLLNGDTVTAASLSSVATAATTGISVEGEYGIDISDAVGTGLGNYDITYVPGIFTVTQAALSVIADDQTKTYGTAFAFDGTEFTTEGLLNGDTVTAASLSSVATAATTGISVEGEYGIDISDAVGTGLGNYDITYVPGIFTVTQAALSVIADDQTKTYGTAFAFDGTEFTTEGLLNGDTVTAASLSSVATAATTGISVEGEYGIDISDAVGTGLGNYSITYVAGDFTVIPAPLSITAENQIKVAGTLLTFDGTEFTTSGLRNDDAVTFADLSSDGAGAEALPADSPFAIEIGEIEGNGLGNYDITREPGSLAVVVEEVEPRVIDPVPPFVATLPNPPDTNTLALVGAGTDGGDTGADGSDGGSLSQVQSAGQGGSELREATETLAAVDTVSSDFQVQVATCGVSDQDIANYMACLAESLETYANALDVLENTLPRGLEDVSAIIQTARAGVQQSGVRAAQRLATATSDAERQAIRADAVAEARSAVATAQVEVRKAIALIRAEDPDLVQVQSDVVQRIDVAFAAVDTALLRAVEL